MIMAMVIVIMVAVFIMQFATIKRQQHIIKDLRAKEAFYKQYHVIDLEDTLKAPKGTPNPITEVMDKGSDIEEELRPHDILKTM